VQIIRGTTRK